MLIQPATIDTGHTVECCDAVIGEEGSADVTDKATDAMDSENIKGVVDAQNELELGRIVRKRGTQDSKDNS